LLDTLWDAQPPPTAKTALQGYVSSLRKLIGAERIETLPAGYALRLRRGELDAERFESMVAEAGQTDDAARRLQVLSSGLALWRGEALADFRYDEFAQAELTRLGERRLAALEERLDAELALGRHAEVLAELEQLVTEQPLRERLRQQLMIALYRVGRQSDALHAYQEGRRVLAEEVGIDPGSALQELERQILAQDPELDLPDPAVAAQRQERKRVTVLVAELSGPSDPEELAVLLGPALERTEETLRRFGATVQPLFANALIGIFGAPRAYEDDPERAVRAGAALVDTVSEDGRLVAHVGIERGDALVTIQDGRVEVTGEVVAAASRLQATAAANEVALGEALKRLRATHEGREVPFVGRRHELGLLEHTHGRVVGERAAHLVTIAGEPGSGKTRLTLEFAAFLERAESHAWLAGRCLPYGDGVTFWALGEIVKAAAGIFESDDPETSARKLAATLSMVLARRDDRVWVEAALAPLVGLAGSRSATREQSFPAWRRFLEAMAERQPLVLLIEDLHWADAALLEFVDDLVARAVDVPLLVLCTTRLELLDTHPDWVSAKRNASLITLPPLSSEETRELARALLDGEEPAAAVVARAGGNPLFVQELTRVELTDVDSLPESMHAVIAARLDALPPAVKQTAMDAAVLGEVFWPGGVASIAGVEEDEVRARLQQLVASEVVRRAWTSSVQGQEEHAFLHVVVRDVAYEQIPKARRAQKHATAGAWIEQLAGERVLDHAELIAYHYVTALEYGGNGELPAKASRFLTLAGDRSVLLNLVAAEQFYRRALELVPEGDPERGNLLARIARTAADAGRLADAERLYEQAVAELRRAGDARALGGALTSLYRVLWLRGAGREARSVFAEALRILERAPDGPELAAAYIALTRACPLSERPRRAIKWAERAIALARRLELHNYTVHGLAYRGYARCESNDLGGVDDLREAVRLGLEAGVGTETANAYNNLADWVALTKGPQSSLGLYAEGIEIAGRRGLERVAYWLRMSKLERLFELGDWDGLLRLADELVTWDRSRGKSLVMPIALPLTASVLVRRGEVVKARSLVEASLEPARRFADPQVLTQALAYAALVEQASGDAAAAIERLDELVRTTPARASTYRARYLTDAARVCAAAGWIEPARRLGAGLDVVAPDLVYRVLSARAVLAEAEGSRIEALEGYAEAAARWHEFGNVVEEAYALLGRGRCALALGREEEAPDPLAAARVIFERLGARPLIAEIDGLVPEERLETLV
jgi:DNA-binding SARP family transcriptional activator